MRRRWWVLALGAVLLVLLGAWWLRGAGSGGARRVPAGMLAVQWSGTRRGVATLPAKVSWCPVNRTGVVEAIAGDTGVAVVLYEDNALTAGTHPVVPPSGTAPPVRPAASVVMRWPPDSAVLLGFTSRSGEVVLRPAGQRLSGTLRLRMHGSLAGDSLTLSGRFVDLPVVTMAVGCP